MVVIPIATSKRARLAFSVAVALLIAFRATTAFGQGKASKVDVIIGFNSAPGAAGDALIKGLGGAINSRYSIINARAATIPSNAVSALQANPNVAYVEEDGFKELHTDSADGELQWGVNRIDGEAVWATTAGVRYLDWGGDATPLLALHGLASSSHWYDLVAPGLREKYRIIAPDQRGHGKTTQAASGYDWPTLASDAVGLMALLDTGKVPGGFAVLGHSWGGNVAINVAALHPDHVRALVLIEGGILAGPSRFAPTWEDFRQRLAPRNVSGDRRDFLDRISSQLGTAWDEGVERIVQTMVWEDDQGQIHDILRPDNQAQVIWQMWHRPASDTWPLISCPALIVVAGPTPERAGSEFALLKQAGVEAANEAIKGSRVHWVPESIHDIGYHKPKELAGVIDEFLSVL